MTLPAVMTSTPGKGLVPEPVITVSRLTKKFGNLRAVDDLSFEVARGRVTGFLGPNGAGKTTTVRMILGLARPSSGEALIAGRPYVELDDPARVVGSLLDGVGAHPGRSARSHLRVLAAQRGIDEAAIDRALASVDLSGSADRRVGAFSLGMRQRLGLAAAILGDARLLILDEPANGLDPAGARWLRSFLRDFVREGRSVFVSSHQLAEIAQLADDVVVLNRGTFVTHQPVAVLTSATGAAAKTPQALQLELAVREAHADVQRRGDELIVRGLTTAAVGEIAAREGIALHELTPLTRSLEDVFLSITGDGGQS